MRDTVLKKRHFLFSEHDKLIICGHRMNDNSMFGTLHRFARETYYEHPVMYFLIPDQNYRFEICIHPVPELLPDGCFRIGRNSDCGAFHLHEIQRNQGSAHSALRRPRSDRVIEGSWTS